MKNKGVMISLAAILVIGILITKGTYHFIEKNSADLGVEAGLAEGAGEDSGIAGGILVEERQVLTEAIAGEDGGSSENGQAAGGRSAETGAAHRSEADSKAGSGAVSREAAENNPLSAGGVMNRALAEDQAEDAEGSPLLCEEPSYESISPLDTVPADKAEKEAVLTEVQSYYKKRLLDLDSQIEKNRKSQQLSGLNFSARSAASNELKLWDGELNAIYNAVLERLDQERSELLVAEQRVWMKERDSLAMEAAKNSAGSTSESVEYTASLAESTRLRAYELVEEYAEELGE